MTVINPNSISGITSITMPSGDGNVLTIHTNDGTERFRIDSSGNVKVGSACTISQDGDVFFTGVTTATTFAGAHSGSGANLTSLPAAQLTGSLPAISGANLTGIAATDNVRTGILDVAGVSTFRNTMNVGAAVTISESGIEASGIGITVANINGTQIGGRRNFIINGAMQVAQRATSFATVNNEYTLDRFRINGSHDGAITVTQSTTSPDGFSKSLKVDVTTADTSIASGQYSQLTYKVEAQDLQDLAYGTSAAKTISASFYVRSNLTGTYTFAIQQSDNSGKQVTQTYTINSANTWERKTFTFAGDTSGVINDDNGKGFDIYWNLAIGSQYTTGTSRSVWTTNADADFAAGHTANLLSSTSNEFYLTGVQLEVGSQVTSFEHRSVGEELALCQRYYYIVADGREDSQLGTGFAYHANQPEITLHYPVMRASPSLVHTTGTNYYQAANTNNNATWDNFSWYQPSPRVGLLYQGNVGGSPLSSGQAYRLQFNSDQAYIHLSAEL